MRAFVHAFQGRPWNEECQTAYNGFKKLGVECVLFTTNEELEIRQVEDIVVGGMLIMGHVMSEDNIKIPNYNYPDELTSYLGRNIWRTKIKNLNAEKLPMFIKPEEEKSAKGIVVRSWDEILEYERLDSEAELLCSEVINLVSEWRVFVRYGEILGIQFYNGDMHTTCDEMIITNAIKDFKTMPAAFSLDFGVTKDGRTLLIEMNDGFAIGCYGLKDELYAMFLYARWAELEGCLDPWK